MNTIPQFDPYEIARSYEQVARTIPDVLQRMQSAGIGNKEIFWTKNWIEGLKRFCKKRGSQEISRQSGLDFLADLGSGVAPDDVKGLWCVEQATFALKYLFVLTGKGRLGTAIPAANSHQTTRVVNSSLQRPNGSPAGVVRCPVSTSPVAVCLDEKVPPWLGSG